jgi:hypothetical protein
MWIREIRELVDSTQIRFAVDGSGQSFEQRPKRCSLRHCRTGRTCEIIQGMDECGPVSQPTAASKATENIIPSATLIWK